MTLQHPPDVASIQVFGAGVRSDIRFVHGNVEVAASIEKLRNDLSVAALDALKNFTNQ